MEQFYCRCTVWNVICGHHYCLCIQQELVNEKNNNKLPPLRDSAPSPETQLANEAVLELERQTQEQHKLERQNKVLEEKSKDQEERITELEKKLASSLQENKELKDELDQATNQLSGMGFLCLKQPIAVVLPYEFGLKLCDQPTDQPTNMFGFNHMVSSKLPNSFQVWMG